MSNGGGAMNDDGRERGEIRELLPDWVAGRLEPEASRRVGEAVARDEDLGAEAHLLASVLEARPRPPEGLAARITTAVRAERDAPGRPPALDPSRRGLPRWIVAAAAVVVLSLGALELAEGPGTAAGAGSPLDQVALDDAPDPWGESVTITSAPVLDGLSDEALSSLLEELEG